MSPVVDVTEQKRLNEACIASKKWESYLSERQWGTVREEGLSDDYQQLCFALALWNEGDPLLKERLFGLTNSEANHWGEDQPTPSLGGVGPVAIQATHHELGDYWLPCKVAGIVEEEQSRGSQTASAAPSRKR